VSLPRKCNEETHQAHETSAARIGPSLTVSGYPQSPTALALQLVSSHVQGAHMRATRPRSGARGPHERARGFGAQPRLSNAA